MSESGTYLAETTQLQQRLGLWQNFHRSSSRGTWICVSADFSHHPFEDVHGPIQRELGTKLHCSVPRHCQASCFRARDESGFAHPLALTSVKSHQRALVHAQRSVDAIHAACVDTRAARGHRQSGSGMCKSNVPVWPLSPARRDMPRILYAYSSSRYGAENPLVYSSHAIFGQCQRKDVGTSGVKVAAETEGYRQQFVRRNGAGMVSKTYAALVEHDSASTSLRGSTIESGTLDAVEVSIHGGMFHQIRVHARELGLTVASAPDDGLSLAPHMRGCCRLHHILT
eukprot:5563176-Amphidinium_carterae.3